MVKEKETEDRSRKVIPYDGAFGKPGMSTNEDVPENEDMVHGNAPDSPELPNFDIDESQQTQDRLSQDGIGGKDETGDGQTEFAREIAHWGPIVGKRDGGSDDHAESVRVWKGRPGKWWGVTGVIFSLVSFFLWPLLFAPSSVAIGAVAFRRGARVEGIWAIVIGGIILLRTVFGLPTFYR